MHVLWLIPDYYSFLIEEMTALAPLVDKLSVLSQAPPRSITKVECLTIPCDSISLTRIGARSVYFFRAFAQVSFLAGPGDISKLRRFARHAEVMRNFVRRENVNVIHSHFAVPEGTCGWQAACGRPVVATLRGVDILTLPEVGYGFMRDPFYARNLRRSLSRVAAITVASRQTLDATRKLMGDSDRLHLIPNGIDLDRFSSVDPQLVLRLRAKLNLQGQQMLLAAGNLVPRKAFDVLLKAFREVRSSAKDTELVIAGEGPERTRLEQLALELGIDHAVHLVGRISREEIPVYFAASDVFVHSSLSEGFGNVVLEAMAAGRPVVATRTGAAADIIEDRVNGILVSTGSVEELANGITHVFSHADDARQMASRGQELVRNSLSMERRVQGFIDLYHKVLA